MSVLEETSQTRVIPEIYPRDQHQISRKQIDPDALKIMYRLLRHNYKAYLVGGGVRDLLLRKAPKDFDIVTDATPRRIKSIFRNSRIIGRRFKLVHIFFAHGKNIEVCTFRDFHDPIGPEDPEESDSMQLIRDNKYGTEETDALRRDITINGLFYDLSSFSIIDYVGGVKDLSEGVIRMIGEPNQRFIEDPVRMIRVVRHAARASFRIEKNCEEAIFTNRRLILKSPPMRVYDEIKKDLSSGHFLKIARLLAQTELLEFIFPELLEDYPALFDEQTLISYLFNKIDEQGRSKTLSASVVLAIISLAKAKLPSSLAKLSSVFDSEDDLYAHFHNCLRTLAVPRRDREKALSILSEWWTLAQGESEGFRRPPLRRNEYYEDLLTFLDIIEAQECLSKLEAPPDRLSGERAQRMRRRRRRGGQSQHMQRMRTMKGSTRGWR